MRSRQMENLVIGLIVGFGLGVVFGVLFAPASGERTRRRIAEEAVRVGDAARLVAERAERAAGTAQDRFEHYLGRDEELAWRKVRELREGMAHYTRTQPES